MDEGIIRNM